MATVASSSALNSPAALQQLQSGHGEVELLQDSIDGLEMARSGLVTETQELRAVLRELSLSLSTTLKESGGSGVSFNAFDSEVSHDGHLRVRN